MDRERRALRDSTKDVRITSNERTLRDDNDREPLMCSERLEHAPRDSESTLRRLIRIGCRTHDDDFAARQRLETRTAGPQLVSENGGRVAFHEHMPLEREPWRYGFNLSSELVARGGGRQRPIDCIAMGVARVAIRTTERAAHVR